MAEEGTLARPAEEGPLSEAAGSIWEGYHREFARTGKVGLDVFFLAFLRRHERFGYFSLGPITIDVRLIESLVGEDLNADTSQPPPMGDEMERFSHLLAAEIRRSGSQRPDDLHILLALMRSGESLPGRVFGELGVTPEQIEQFVRSTGRRPSAGDKLYSPEEAAEYLGVHVQTIRSWIRSGRLRASRLTGQRALRIAHSDLQAVLEPVGPNEVDG
jgi:excisionase family DNA binding protein